MRITKTAPKKPTGNELEMSRRRGAISILVTALIIVFLIVVVFSVDVAYIQLTRIKLRSATDASARACGESLSRAQNLGEARQAAKDVAAANLVAGEPLILEDEDIVFGNSTRDPGGSWTFTANANPINSVRVNGRRTSDSPSGSVGLFFARVLGHSDFEPTQLATVVRLDRDVCLVVDRSSSMKLHLTDTAPTMSTSDPRFCEPPDPVQSRWAALESAIQVFTDELDNTPQSEYVGLASYASNGNWCGYSNNVADINQPITADDSLVNSAMQTLTASVFNGATNITAGVNAGVSALTDPAHARPYTAKTMVLFTDGHATQGGSPVPAAETAADQNIVIHTVTFGDGANQADMIDVAEATGGNHYHAPDAQTLEDIFREIALNLPVTLTE